jgi:hypothetical protein
MLAPDLLEIDRRPQPLDAGPEPSPRRAANVHLSGSGDLLTHDDLLDSTRRRFDACR